MQAPLVEQNPFEKANMSKLTILNESVANTESGELLQQRMKVKIKSVLIIVMANRGLIAN